MRPEIGKWELENRTWVPKVVTSDSWFRSSLLGFLCAAEV